MSIAISQLGDTVILGVGEQLVVSNRHELKQAFLDALEQGKRKFRIDFQNTTALDSSGLGVLVSLSKRLREQGGELRLVHLNKDLRTLFSLTKLDTLFQIDEGDDGGAARPAPRAPRSAVRGSDQAEPPA